MTYRFEHIAIAKVILIVMMFTNNLVWAQNVCTEKLSRAEMVYESGHLYEIYDLIAECLQDGFSREEKIKAYRLLTITYLYLDEHDKADETYLLLLKLNPEYEPNLAVDPIELLYHHDRFLTTPRWSVVMAKIGLNLSLLRPYNSYSTDGFGQNLLSTVDEANISLHSKEYVPGAGITIGSGIKYGYSKNLSLTMELLLKLNRYKIKERILGHSTLIFNEEQYSVELPIFISYSFPDLKFKPYILGGASLNYLIHSSAKNIKMERQQGATLLPESGPNVMLSPNRNSFGYSALFGAGVQYKVGIDYLFIEVRQSFGLKNMTSRSNRYGNHEMLYKYMYIDDDMRMDNLMINVNYVKPFYNPRKKKNR